VTEETSPCHLFVPRSRVAMRSASLPAKLATISSPQRSGAESLMEFSRRAAFKMFSLGIGCVVFTGRRGKNPPLTLTVPVKTRRGSVAS